jgi:hypothetical protein
MECAMRAAQLDMGDLNRISFATRVARLAETVLWS